MAIKNSEIDIYQQRAFHFAKFGEMQVYPFLGLAEEAGEVAGKYAKFLRKEHMEPDFFISCEVEENLKEDLMDELGDVLWQLSACATTMGVQLSEIAKRNIEKLEGRASRGTIVGEGDIR